MRDILLIAGAVYLAAFIAFGLFLAASAFAGLGPFRDKGYDA